MTEPNLEERAGQPKRRWDPAVLAVIAAGLLILLLLAVAAWRGRTDEDKLSDDQTAASRADEPEKRCASQATYDLIKRELFRRAAALRGSDQAAFDKLSAYSVVRMEAPMLKSEDEKVGAVACTGALTLDLPPGVAVVGGRRSLAANIDYALQKAADGSGNVLTLANADPIVTPLATLARIGRPAGEPLAPPPAAPPPAMPGDPLGPEPLAPPAAAPSSPPPAAAPPPSPPTAVSASPSFNCRNARTRGEIAVCGDGGLAALDRQMAAQFNRAMGEATPEQRQLLQRTRGRFLTFRDRCRTDDCVADAYRGRMREIADIVAGRWAAPR